jgi:hypothetical protein
MTKCWEFSDGLMKGRIMSPRVRKDGKMAKCWDFSDVPIVIREKHSMAKIKAQ